MTNTPTFFGLTRTKAEALVWRSTHRDYRSDGTGERRILILRNNVTLSVAIVDLTEQELTDRVESGLRFQHRQAFVKAGLIVYPRRTPWAGAVDLDGRAFVVNLITGERRLEAEATAGASQEKKMQDAFVRSEAAADRMANATALAA